MPHSFSNCKKLYRVTLVVLILALLMTGWTPARAERLALLPLNDFSADYNGIDLFCG